MTIGTTKLGPGQHPRSSPRAFGQTLRESRPAQAGLIAATLAGAILGGALGASREPAAPATPAPSPAARTAATAPATAAAPSGRPVALDACTLVTTAEASAVLGKLVETRSGIAGRSLAECNYTPASQVDLAFDQGQRTATTVSITRVVLTLATGPDAATHYDSSLAAFGTGTQKYFDTQVSGLGDKAIVTGMNLSVLRSEAFLKVHFEGAVQRSSSTTDPSAAAIDKVRALLQEFARLALPRVAAAPATTSAPTALTAAAQPASTAQAQERAPAPSGGTGVPGAVAGAVVGLLGGLAAFGAYSAVAPPRARRRTRLEQIDDRIEALRKKVWGEQGLGTYSGMAIDLGHEKRYKPELDELEELQNMRERLLAGKPLFELPPTIEALEERIKKLNLIDPQGLDATTTDEIDFLEANRGQVASTEARTRSEMPGLPQDEVFTPKEKKPDLDVM